MACVGIDFGAKTFTVGSAAGQDAAGAGGKRGGISIVLNEATSRFTPGLVTFHENKRFVGQMAEPLEKQQFKKTIKNIKQLLGGRYSDPAIQEELKRCFFKTVQLEGDKIGCQVEHNGETKTFTPTQILAMQLNNINDFTKLWSGKANCDFVMSVPAYFNVAQRLAVRDAANIAGVNVLRLANEGTAAALGYGIFKQGLDDETPHNVMFVDMGYTQMTVTIVAFTKAGLTVKGTASDPTIGGRLLDEGIANKLADEFQAKTKVDVRAIPSKKAWIKLMKAAEKLKKTLTPLGVNKAMCSEECLYQEHDFRGSISQDEFDGMFGWLPERIPGPITAALALAGLTPKDIDNVQVFGGTTRIPMVRRVIANTMERDETAQNFGLSCTLNPDECVARGCALQAAILSPLLRVRAYEVKDCVSHPISILWKQPSPDGGDEVDQKIAIFKSGDAYPAYKRVTFKRNKQFEIRAEYANSPAADALVGTFTVGDHADMADIESPKIKVNIAFDADGIFSVRSACFMKQKPEEAAPQPAPEATAEAGKEEDKKPTEDAKPVEEKPVDGEEKPAADGEEKPAADGAADAGTEGAEEAKVVEAPKPKFIQVNLDVTSQIEGGLDTAGLDKARNDEAQLAQEERVSREREEKRNDLESYVYDTREKMQSEEYSKYLADEPRAAFLKDCDDMEEWLYTDEGYDSEKSVFVLKFAQLADVAGPALARKHERETIGEQYEAFRLAQKGDLTVVNNQDEKFAHITEKERDTVRKAWGAANKEVQDGIAKNKATPEHDGLPLTCAMINSKRVACIAKCVAIVNKPKPKPEPVPEPEVAKEEGEPAADNKEAEAPASDAKEEAKTDAPSPPEPEVD